MNITSFANSGDVSDALRVLFDQRVDEDDAPVFVAGAPGFRENMMEFMTAARDMGRPAVIADLDFIFDVDEPLWIGLLNADPCGPLAAHLGLALWASTNRDSGTILVPHDGCTDRAFAVTPQGLVEARVNLGLECSLRPGMQRAMVRLANATIAAAGQRHGILPLAA